MVDPVISPDPDRVAVCLSCGNEWVVRTAGTGKKRKCPVCGRYRVRMKSEMISSGSEGVEVANEPEGENLPPAPPARVEVPAKDTKTEEEKKVEKVKKEKKEKKEEEKKEKKKVNRARPYHPDVDEEDEEEEVDEEEVDDEEKPAAAAQGMIYVAMLVVAVGAGWILYNALRRRRRPVPVLTEYEDETIPRRYVPFPGF